MVAPIVNTSAQIVLKGMEIFSDERRRNLSKQYNEVLQAVNDAENAQWPEYSDAKLALAVERRESFLSAYYVEFAARVDSIKLAGAGGVLT